MPRLLRRQPLTALLLALALPAGAADVSLELESLTIHRCRPCEPSVEFCGGYYGWYYYYYYDEVCDVSHVPQLTPAVPQGGGSVHFDTDGVLIGGTLQLGGYTEDGTSVAPWAREVERRDVRLRDGFLALDDGWGDAVLSLTSFTDQTAFTGRLVNRYSRMTAAGEERVEETYRFSALPGSPVQCAGERLYFDVDGDGEEDARDQIDSTAFGARVDAAGITNGDFCGLASSSNRQCTRSDFLNDEPRRRRPGDCKYFRGTVAPRCRPAEFFSPVSPPVFSGSTCLGLPIFSDTDGDTEDDSTDRCPATPAGAAIDWDGCSVAEFCALQPASGCLRADFMNDEPLPKRPRDCVRRERQCTAAAQ